MHTLNRQRANIVFSTLIEKDIVLTPEEVSKQERIFEWDGALRWRGGKVLGTCQIGVELKVLVDMLGSETHQQTGAVKGIEYSLARLLQTHAAHEFVPLIDPPRRKSVIVLKQGASAASQLKAWVFVLIIIKETEGAVLRETDGVFVKELEGSTGLVEMQPRLGRIIGDFLGRFDDSVRRLKAAGWDVDVAALETRSGSRINIQELGS